MSRPEELLIVFSYMLIVALAMAIMIPVLGRRADLLTVRNLLLVGSMNYIGLAGLKAGYQSEEFRVLEYSKSDYYLYMAGAATFVVSFLLAYHLIKLPRTVAGCTFRKWPPPTTSVLFLTLFITLSAAVLSLFPIPIQGVRQVIFFAGNKGIAMSTMFAFIAWYRNKINPLMIATLVGVAFSCMLISIVSGSGRRTMVGVLLTFPIAYYWLDLRYRRPTRVILTLGACAAAVFVMVAAYSQVRHYDQGVDGKSRSVGESLNALLKLPQKILSAGNATNQIIGQNAAQTSLAAIHIYTKERDPEPFHTLYFVASAPIPRSVWPEKPLGLGYTLPKTARAKGTRATWGPGIVGHGFHEGGLHMLVLYGLLVAMVARYVDELLVRQPSNPYLLGAFAAAAGHIIGWVRGDIGTFTLQLLYTVFAMLALSLIGRLFFGTGTVYPRTSGPEYVNQNLFRRQNALPG